MTRPLNRRRSRHSLLQPIGHKQRRQRNTIGRLSIVHQLPRQLNLHRRPHGSQIQSGGLPSTLKIPLARFSFTLFLPSRHRLGLCDDICLDCNALHWIEERSPRGTKEVPKFSTCCMNGGISLPELLDAPTLLEDLLKDESNVGSSFRTLIRNYNNALAFSSLGVMMDKSVAGQAGVYTFKIQGELVHRIGSLLPSPGDIPRFAQIHILDSSSLITPFQLRMSHQHGLLNEDILLRLTNMLDTINPYFHIFRTASEKLQETGSIALHLKTIDVPHLDSRRYNRPTATEVAVIMPGTGEEPIDHREIVLHSRAGPLRRISELHSAYLPLRYPLLHPYGEQGWCLALHKSSNKKITQRAFYAYRFFQRSNSGFKILHHAGKLFQEYIVDAYAQWEQNRLGYLRKQQEQQELRSDLLVGIADAAADGISLENIGSKTILPSSFVGGPRFMQQLYHDSMAIVRAHTKPDLFITMTCNPKWPEITENLAPSQTAQDRPDLVVRVFNLKLSALLDDLLTNGVLGQVIAHMYVIEFQKRGLPHAHILLILAPADKPITPQDIDSIVSAQLPNQDSYPDLYDTIISCMLHGPCGVHNINAPCMVDGKCSKQYPKAFSEETIITTDHYPQYKRPNNGASTNRGGHTFTNQHVVPYNPYLSAKYNCHINVEVANGILAVKYLYKYVYKGHDRTAISIESDNEHQLPRDEIKEYIDARYVSASEACWHFFDFPLHHRYPPVQRLQLHLKDHQKVPFHPNRQTARQLLQRPDLYRTTLTAFFETCAQYRDITANLLYPDFPTKFVWQTGSKSWKLRERGFSIGRVYFSVPSDGERYFLRMLLYNVPGPTSFEDLRRYEGIEYPTFQEACLARGLLESDNEWDKCLEEAGLIQTGSQLRNLFAMILINNSPANPLGLFNTHLPNLSDDCRYKLQHQFQYAHPNEIQITSLVLYYLQILLQRAGKSLTDYNLPLPVINFDELNGMPRILVEEMSYNTAELQDKWQKGYEMANLQQKQVLNTITAAVDSEAGGLFFIDGPGGTGKTFVENLLLSYIRSSGGIALSVASSGIASILLDGGRTAHSRFKIPLDIQENSICSISAQTSLGDLIRRTKLIVWDEAPAQHRYCFEAVDRTFKDIRKSKEWFGGITMVFGGDFRQCLPVIPRASRPQIVASTISNATFWKAVVHFKLNVNMRLLSQAAQMDPQHLHYAQTFADWLLRIGNGEGNNSMLSDDYEISLLERLCLPHSLQPIQQLIAKIYPDLDSLKYKNEESHLQYFSERAILAPLNVDVDELNQCCLERMNGISNTYSSVDIALDAAGGPDYSFPTEYLNTINLSGMPTHNLTLKVGCPLILLRSLNLFNGLCNGTRMIVTTLRQHVLEVKILSGTHHGKTAFIPRIPLITSTSSGLPFTLRRRQFPVRLAFGMTINKSQGQSLSIVGVHLLTPVFAHGQLYVALSRATNCENVYVSLSSQDKKTVNVVYKEVLR